MQDNLADDHFHGQVLDVRGLVHRKIKLFESDNPVGPGIFLQNDLVVRLLDERVFSVALVTLLGPPAPCL